MIRQPAQPPATRPIAVVSHTLPGDPNGQAVMLDRLTARASGQGFVCIDTDRKAHVRAVRDNWLASVPLPTPAVLRKCYRLPWAHLHLYHLLVRHRSRAIARIVRQHGCQSIVTCTGGDLIDLPAAVEAGRLTGVPTFLYYFDDYQIQWTMPGGRWSREAADALRDVAEAISLDRCAGVFVPNEHLARVVETRTTKPVSVIRNPVDTSAYRALRSQFPRRPLDPSRSLSIVYTGSVYAAQADCLQRLCDAVALLKDQGVHLEVHVLGPPPEPRTANLLPIDAITWHPAVSTSEAAVAQVQADILFLPLSFTCEFPELIRTSAPGKFGEYLASGTPLLVHTPADAFPHSFVTEHACAATCGVPESRALASALADLIAQSSVCEAMRQRAIDLAEEFALDVNRERFIQLASATPDRRAAPTPAAGSRRVRERRGRNS